jgi:predicted enzyme related to lactoylglutathione lyase
MSARLLHSSAARWELVSCVGHSVRKALGMAIRLGSTVINCADMELMTSFWSRALNLVPSSAADDDDFRVLRGGHVNLSLQLAHTVISARDQMHLDLYTNDQAAEVQRLAGLGARVVRHQRDPGDDYVVMTDPEGNEFCVCAVANL